MRADLLRPMVSALMPGQLLLRRHVNRRPPAAALHDVNQLAQRFEPLAVDEAVSDAWALLVSRLRAEGRKAPINDSWIAATAIAHGVPIVTQDSDYDAMPGVEVIKI